MFTVSISSDLCVRLAANFRFKAFGIMLGYIAGVVFRDVLDGDSQICESHQPQNVLLGVNCVSPQHSLLEMYRGASLIHRCL